MVIAAPVLASGTDVDVRQSNDLNNQTTGDVSHSSEAWGFSHSLGDVDINQCLGSTQWGTILVSKQKLVLNKWCAAEVYDAKGLYLVAARMRCQIPEVAELFATNDECVGENEMTPPPPPVEAPPPEVNLEEDEEYEMYEQRIAQLEEQINRPPPPARVTREVIQQPRITEAQRQALAEVIAK